MAVSGTTSVISPWSCWGMDSHGRARGGASTAGLGTSNKPGARDTLSLASQQRKTDQSSWTILSASRPSQGAGPNPVASITWEPEDGKGEHQHNGNRTRRIAWMRVSSCFPLLYPPPPRLAVHPPSPRQNTTAVATHKLTHTHTHTSSTCFPSLLLFLDASLFSLFLLAAVI